MYKRRKIRVRIKEERSVSKIKYSFNSFYSCSKNLVVKKSCVQKISWSKEREIRVQ